MLSSLRLRWLINLASLALFGVFFAIFIKIAATSHLRGNARDIPVTDIEAEVIKLEPPRNIQDEEPPLDVQNIWEVKCVLRVGCAVVGVKYEKREKQIQYLINIGDKAFPAYETILKDPKADPLDVSGVLGILIDVNTDRSRFLKYALSRLTDPDGGVRLAAVVLLKRIGSSAEASAVVSLISDEDTVVAYYAAGTLAAIGGPHELEGMNKWLSGGSQRDFPELRAHVQKCRDALKKRLDANKATKK